MATVVITRPESEVRELMMLCKQRGLDFFVFPAIQICPLELRDQELEAILGAFLGRYDWLLFTSQNGVRAFFSAVSDNEIFARGISCKIGVQGEGTAAEVKRLFNLTPNLVAPDGTLESFGEELSTGHDIEGRRFLLPVAAETRSVLLDIIKAQNGSSTVVPVYETKPVVPNRALIDSLASSKKPIIFTFFSPSAFKSVVAALREQEDLIKESKIVTIGPITSNAVKGLGFSVWLESSTRRPEAVIEEISKKLIAF